MTVAKTTPGKDEDDRTRAERAGPAPAQPGRHSPANTVRQTQPDRHSPTDTVRWGSVPATVTVPRIA